MFRPRHAYRSPTTSRYRGKAKGCPVFNNPNEISSAMVEQHDECLECLAKLKNRSDLYKTLADNNKPSNNVIKSLQRLSSSASNNRLKTCLQFLIIKVNEKSISTPKQVAAPTNGSVSPRSTVHGTDIMKDASSDYVVVDQTQLDPASLGLALKSANTKSLSKRQKFRHQQPKQNHQKSNQHANSPPQDQVSSTQDQIEPSLDDHDCQTSPLMSIDSHIDDHNHDEQTVDNSTTTTTTSCNMKMIDYDGPATTMTSSTMHIKSEEETSHHQRCYMTAQSTQSSPPVSSCNPLSPTGENRTVTPINQVSTATSTSTSTTTTSTSPLHTIDYDSIEKSCPMSKNIIEELIDNGDKPDDIVFNNQSKSASVRSTGSIGSSGGSSASCSSSSSSSASCKSSTDGASNDSSPSAINIVSEVNKRLDIRLQNQEIHAQPETKRRRIQNSLGSDHETSSSTSWSLASYGAGSPPSPISSASSTSSLSSNDSTDSETSSHCSASSSCSSTYTHSSSPQPPSLSSPHSMLSDSNLGLRAPKLKLSEDKLRKIKKRPVLYDDYFYAHEESYKHHRQHSTLNTPISVICSPGQQSSTTQHSDQSSSNPGSCMSSSLGSCLGLPATTMMMHMFQAPPSFVNILKPCNLPKPKSHEPTPPSSTPPVPQAKVELINCAICGIKEKPPKISKIFGQNSCLLCTEFFADFLKSPKQYYCAHDGDCLMTFDSRCQACWIKICLQKFDVDEVNRKIGEKYSPKLLLSPNVSLITIDTSVPD